MRFAAGTSGFAYKEWKGIFYPDDVAADDMLRAYAERLPAVEINNTFYRMPKESVVESWYDKAPEGFLFVIKASRRITHFQRLVDVDDTLDYLFRVTAALKDKRGPTLFQLPPQMKKDVERLRGFLEKLPDDCRPVLEFRHASWFDDETYEALRARNAALCINDIEDPKQSAPFVATADWGYVRLRREGYSPEDVDGWARRIAGQPWEQAYAFFDHKEEGPLLAGALNARFAEAVARAAPSD